MRLIDADALTDFLKCLLPERGMWEIDGDVGKMLYVKLLLKQ